MRVKESAVRNRDVSYGEHRRFRGLETFAIQRRLKAARRLLDMFVKKDPNGKFDVLELGCGFWGQNLIILSEDYVNLSFIGVGLSVSRDVAGVQLLQADISNWKFSRKYDAVLSLAVVEHLSEPQQHFNLMADCVEKGGLVGLTTPSPQSQLTLQILATLGNFDRSEIEDHKLYLPETGIRNMAGNSTLSVEEFRTFSLGMNQRAMMRKN